MSEYRQRSNGILISDADFRGQFPDQSFPVILTAETLAAYGYDPVLNGPQPNYDPATNILVRDGVTQVNGQWFTAWKVEDIPAETLAAQAADALKIFKADVVRRIQKRLDDFAHTRGYGDENGNGAIVSACSYATSKNPRFAAEAEYCVDARDATWAKLYEIDAAVTAGNWPAPTTYEEIEVELPPLAWPAEATTTPPPATTTPEPTTTPAP